MSFKKLALAGGVAATLMASTAYASVIDRPFFQVLGVVVVWGADSANATAPVVSDFVLLTTGSGNEGADLIAGDVNTVLTGTLDPITGGASTAGFIDPATGAVATAGVDNGTDAGVLDAGDTLSAFGVTATTDIDSTLAPNSFTSSFYVASNAAFDVYAQSSNFAGTGELGGSTTMADIKLAMSIDSGAAATTAGAGSLSFGSASQDPGSASIPTGMDLGQMTAGNGLQVLDGTQRTAASVGTLAEQSVRFNNVYTLGTGGYDMSQGAGTVSADVTYTIFVP